MAATVRRSIGRLSVRDLALAWHDEETDTALTLRGGSFDLVPRHGTIGGPVAIVSAQARSGTRISAVQRFAGSVAYDGVSLAISDVSVELPEGRLDLSGRVDDIWSAPHLALGVRGAADLERLASFAAFAPNGAAPVGQVAFAGEVTGAATDALIDMTLTGSNIGWGRLDHTSGTLSLHLAGGTADMRAFRWQLAGGTVTGRGRAMFDSGPSSYEITLAWNGIDGSALVDLLTPRGPLRLASRIDGQLSANWMSSGPERIRATASVRALAAGAAARGIRGTLAIDVHDGTWHVTADHWVGDTVHVVSAAEGPVRLTNFGDMPLRGRLRVGTSDLGRAWDVTNAVGLIGAQHDVGLHGDGRVDILVSGSVRSPRGRVDAKASDVRVGDTGPGTIRASAAVSPQRMDIASLDAHLGSNALHARGGFVFDTGMIDGQADWTVASVRELSTRVPERFRPAGAAEGRATVTGRWNDPLVRSTIAGQRLEAAGQQIDRWSADVQVVDRTVLIDRLDLEQAEGRLSASGEYEWEHGTYRLHMMGRDLDVSPVPASGAGAAPIPLHARFDVDFDGAGSLTAPGGQGRVLVTSLSWNNLTPGAIRADVTLDHHALALDLVAPELSATLRASVGLEPVGHFTLDGAVVDLDVSGVFARLPQSTLPIGGTLSLTGRAAGDWSDLAHSSVTIDIQQLALAVGETPVNLVSPAHIAYSDEELAFDDTTVRLGNTDLRIGGRMGIDRPGSLHASMDGQLGDVLSTARAVGERAQVSWPDIDAAGTMALAVTAAGPLDRPVIEGTLAISAVSVATAQLPPIKDVSLDAAYRDGVLTVERLHGTWQDAAIDASGELPAPLLDALLPPTYLASLPASLAPARFTVTAEPITPETLAPFVPESVLAAVEGSVAATLSVEADALSLEHVRGELRLDRAKVTVSGFPISEERPTRVAFEHGRARIVDLAWTGAGSTLVLRGGLTIEADPTLDLTADGTVDLRILGGFARDARTAGRAQIAARIGGNARSPRLGGQIEIIGGQFRQENPRVIVTDLAGVLTLEGDRITGAGLAGSANGGTIAIDTDLRMDEKSAIVGSIAVRGQHLSMNAPYGLRSELNTDVTLHVTGETTALSGTIAVLQGSYREPLSLSSGLLVALQPTAANGLQPASMLDSMALDLRVTTTNDVEVDNSYARLAVGADLTIVGTVGHPGMIGRATPREGGQVFLSGTVYRLAGNGSIAFANASRIEPDLNLTALSRVGKYDVTLKITGTEPNTDLSSDPPLGRADLVSLLVTGRTLAEAPGGQPSIGRAELLGVLSGELGGAAQAIGLDVLRVERGLPAVSFDPGLVAPETNPSSRLTFGKKVTRDVEVIFSQSLQDSGGLTWIISYAPRRNMEVRLVSHDNTDRTYDFRHDVTLGGPPVAVGERPAPRRVAEVRFTGNGSVAVERLLAEVKLSAGDRFDFFRWQNDRERLEAFLHRSGFLEAHVRAQRADTADEAGRPAVALGYDITRGPHTTLTIEGFTFPERVRQELEAAWTRSVFEGFLLDDMSAIARRSLVGSGYLTAVVTGVVASPPDAGEKRIVLRIQPGPRIPHRRIAFTGNVRIATERLDAAMKPARLDEAAWNDSSVLRNALLTLYRDQGMLDAAVRVDPARIQGDQATLPVVIREGAPFTIAAISVVGASAQSPDAVREAFGLNVGDTYRAAMVDEGRSKVLASYRTRGFNALRLDVTAAVVRETSQVQIAIQIVEGPRQVLREILVAGAEHSRPTLVSRALALETGEPVDLAAWQQSMRRMYDSGVFRRVDIDPEPLSAEGSDQSVLETPTPTPKTLPGEEEATRARVVVSELPRFRVRYGVEVSDDARAEGSTASGARWPGVSGDVTYRNLFGLAATTGVAVRYTTNFRAVREFITGPSLLGLPITSAFFVSQSHEIVEATGTLPLVTDKLDLSGEQRFRPARHVEVTYGSTFEHNHTFNKDVVPANFQPTDLTVNSARLTGTVRFDSRDDLMDARRGWFHSSAVTYAPKYFGSEVRFLKYLFVQQYYRTLSPRVVIASAARLGLAHGLDQPSLESDRFFAGGGNSVRGYAEDALSPRDAFGNPVGGNALVVLIQELRFPIVWRLRGVSFVDAGRAFPHVTDLSPSELRGSVGFGLRIDTPFALLRFDVGAPVGRQPAERPARLFFSIGQAF